MWIGEDLDSIVEAITNHHMASVRLKTQACWKIEITQFSVIVQSAKGVEVLQGGSMEPLQTVVVLVRDNHLFMLWIIDDGVGLVEFPSFSSSLVCDAQERLLLIHLTIL